MRPHRFVLAALLSLFCSGAGIVLARAQPSELFTNLHYHAKGD